MAPSGFSPVIHCSQSKYNPTTNHAKYPIEIMYSEYNLNIPLLLILYDNNRQTIIISIKELTITQVGSCITAPSFPVPQTSSANNNVVN